MVRNRATNNEDFVQPTKYPKLPRGAARKLPPKFSQLPDFKYCRTTDRQRMQLIDWSSLSHKLLDAFSGARDSRRLPQRSLDQALWYRLSDTSRWLNILCYVSFPGSEPRQATIFQTQLTWLPHQFVLIAYQYFAPRFRSNMAGFVHDGNFLDILFSPSP